MRTMSLYADDIKIYLEIGDDADIDQLQRGIDRLSVWADTWQLTLAVDKLCICVLDCANRHLNQCTT